ncbi:uncharacterized protein LOC126299397 [Schistocerca gregaria]|uniref:uncharacterized protein LOC126299397 n=1 Tax=Schistocerca gregaria TaxID=7010 RepID=UPI00211F03E6|nr:uncharacterized protein LOC126299397 [Schistocerca gregaria]
MQHVLTLLVLAISAATGSPLRTTEDEQPGPSQLPLVTLDVLKHLEQLPPSQRIAKLENLQNELHFVPQAEPEHRPQEKWWTTSWTFFLPHTVISFTQLLPSTLERPLSARELWNYGY